MEQHYKGPKIVESYLMKKKSKLQGKQGERAVLRYFKFNLTEKSFTYKDDQDTKEIKMIYTGKDLKSFVDSVDKEDQNICEYPHGFQIITSGKPFVLFAQNKELYSKWIRILNFHFNKIDILNPLAFLNSNTVNTVEQTNTKIIQNTVVKSSKEILNQKETFQTKTVQHNRSTSPVTKNFQSNNKKELSDFEFEEEDSINFGKGFKNEKTQNPKQTFSTNNYPINKGNSNSPAKIVNNQVGVSDYEKNRVERYLKNAERSDQTKKVKKETSDTSEKETNQLNKYIGFKQEQVKGNIQENVNLNDDYQKDRVNRYLKNVERAERTNHQSKEISESEDNNKINKGLRNNEKKNFKSDISDNEDYDKNRVGRILKIAEKTQPSGTKKQENIKNDNYEQERVERLLKNVEKTEILSNNKQEDNLFNTNTKNNIIKAGGILSEDDVELIKNFQIGLEKKSKNSKSPGKSLAMDMNFDGDNELTDKNKPSINPFGVKSNNVIIQKEKTNYFQTSSNNNLVRNEVNTKQISINNNQIAFNNKTSINNVNITERIAVNNNQPPIQNIEVVQSNYNKISSSNQIQNNVNNRVINNQNESPNKNQIQGVRNEAQLISISNISQQPMNEVIIHTGKNKNKSLTNNNENPNTDNKQNEIEDINLSREGEIQIKVQSGINKKVENVKEKWQDLNEEWESVTKNKMKEQKEISSVSSKPLYVNSLLPNRNDGSENKIRIISREAPMFDDPSLHIKKSANSKVVNLENLLLKPKQEQEVDLDIPEKQQSSPKVQKKKVANDESFIERHKIFQSKQNVEKDGQNYNIEKKIFFAGKNNFTFQITVPEKFAPHNIESENQQDQRVRMAKARFENKVAEKAIYTGPDPNSKKSGILSKKVPKEPEATGFSLTGEDNMQMNVGSYQMKKSQNQNIKINEQNKGIYTQTTTNYVEELIKDEQHLNVFKTFKVDKHTFVMDDYHQPVEKTIDVRQAEIDKSNKREVQKQEMKYIEIKKDIINKDIKKIVSINQTNLINEQVQFNLGGENQNLGGENMQVPNQKLLESMVPAKKSETGVKHSMISNFAPGEESFFINNQHNFDNDSRLNISKFSKLDIDEVWDNSILGNDDNELFNSNEFKFK